MTDQAKKSPLKGAHSPDQLYHAGPEINPGDQSTLFTALYGVLGNVPGAFGLLRVKPSGRGFDRAEAWEGFVKLDPTRNYYFTANPRPVDFPWRTPRGEPSQGTIKNIEHVVCFFADLDVEHKVHKNGRVHGSEEMALKALETIELRPSMIYRTGHGLQALWLLDRPYSITTETTPSEYENLNARIQKALLADVTKDAPRLLRVPGSVNAKVPNEPVPTKILFYDAAIRHTLEDVRAFGRSEESFPPFVESSPIDGTIAPEKIKKVEAVKPLPAKVRRFLETGKDPDDPACTDQSALLFRLAQQLIQAGFDENEIYSLFSNGEHPLSARFLDRKWTDEQRKKEVARYFEKHAKAEQERNAHIFEELKPLGLDGDTLFFVWRGRIKKHNARELNTRMLRCYTGVQVAKNETEQVVNEIIDFARAKGPIDPNERIGAGVWSLDRESSEPDFKIISGPDTIHVREDGFDPLADPVVDGKIVLFSKPWLDVKAFKDGYASGDLGPVFLELLSLIERWKWKEDGIQSYIAAFLLLLPFQQALPWRPWLWFLGKQATGKSTLLQGLIAGLYPELCESLGKSTAHAVAQRIGNTGKIPLFDEFEKHTHNASILNLLKEASGGAGGKKTSGTPGEDALSFELFHVPVFASIYFVGAGDAAVATRIVPFFMEPHTGGGGVGLQSKKARADLKALGSYGVGALAKRWGTISARAERFREKPELFKIGIKREGETVERTPTARAVDNYAYAAAIVEMIMNARVPLPPSAFETPEDDGKAILDAILSSIVRISGEDHSVGSLLQAGRARDLEKYGIAEHPKDEPRFLAIKPTDVARHVLRDTDFRDYNLKQPLERLPGAIAGRETWASFDGRSQRCVLIPLSELDFTIPGA